MNTYAGRDEIRRVIVDRTRGRWVTGGSKFLGTSDGRYWVPRFNQLKEILDLCRIQHNGNLGEVFDCDDYAMTLKSKLAYVAKNNRFIELNAPIAAGLFWGDASWDGTGQHAGNWFVTREERLVWIEPQYNNADAQRAGNMPIRPSSDGVRHLKLIIY